METPGAFMVAQSSSRLGQIIEGNADAATVADLPLDREALLISTSRGYQIVLPAGYMTQAGE